MSIDWGPDKDTYDAVRDAILEKLGEDDVPFTAHLISDLGADSLDMVEIATVLEDALQLPAGSLEGALFKTGATDRTVRELVVLVDEVRAATRGPGGTAA